MALVLITLVALRETSEKWNGPANTPRCEDRDIIQSWTDDFAEGERAILLRSASFTCRDGIDCVQDTFEGKYGFKCAAKGSGGKGSSGILDPYVTYMLTGATTEFHSEKPCAFFESLGVDAGTGFLPNGTTRYMPEASARVWTPTSAGLCEDTKQGQCAYPPVPAGTYTKLPHADSVTLHEWKGLLMDMGNLNGVSIGGGGQYRLGEDIRHMPIHGLEGTVCDASSDFSYDGAERAFYNGGVLIEKTLGPHLTTRSFMFKSDADRAIAMQDVRNEGLQYAKTFSGDNGCDTEVVYEIKPMTGGGIEMELSVPLDATSCETEQGLRNGIATYFTGEEVVVLVSKSALRASHYLDTSCEADGYKELLRFAANFVCKADGSSVTADIIYLNDVRTPYAPDPSARDSVTYNGETVLALSRDPSNPTLFNTGTGVDYLSASGVCQNPGQERPHGGKFVIVASAAAAPESCGSFYWDPLLQAVEGDGYGFTGPTRGELVLSGDSDDDPCFPGSALVTTWPDGRSVRLDALMDDDEIMAVDSNGAVTSDKVSMLLSVAKPEAEANFVSLTTKSGGELNLTAEHHLPVGASCCTILKKAADLQLGEKVWMVRGASVVSQEVVTKLTRVTSQGLFSPVLTHGSFPVVNGVVTSFDAIGKVTLASFGLAPLLRVCKATGTCGMLRALLGK